MAKPDCKHELVNKSRPHRDQAGRRIYFSCPNCGKEWTETSSLENLSETVTSAEIIEVHRLLSQDHRTLEEAMNPEQPAPPDAPEPEPESEGDDGA